MFGADVGIIHASVVGYGYEFTYNAGDNTYTVPLTGVTPPFSVRSGLLKTAIRPMPPTSPSVCWLTPNKSHRNHRNHRTSRNRPKLLTPHS